MHFIEKIQLRKNLSLISAKKIKKKHRPKRRAKILADGKFREKLSVAII